MKGSVPKEADEEVNVKLKLFNERAVCLPALLWVIKKSK